jgi:hypothetical protein
VGGETHPHKELKENIMLELKYDEKIHLDKWDIDVTPYITIENMESIINDLLDCNYGLERDMRLMADVLVACTDLYNGKKDVHYTYEEVLYSGLWDDILEACPYLRKNIDKINAEVKDLLSVERSVINLIDTLTEKIKDFDVNSLDLSQLTDAIKEVAPVLINNLEEKSE